MNFLRVSRLGVTSLVVALGATAVGVGTASAATHVAPSIVRPLGTSCGTSMCPKFSDVPAGTLFYDQINWMSANGISTGWAEGLGSLPTYRPLLAVGRDAMAAFMYRFAGSPAYTPPTVSPFTDVSTSNQFYKQIAWLASKGISTGWSESNGTKTYRPQLAVKRDAMAAFMYRLAGSPSYAPPTVSPFADVSPSNQFYKQIAWLASKGISTGWSESNGTKTYRPQLAVNRDAMAAFMYRLYPIVKPLTITPTQLPSGMAGINYEAPLQAVGGITYYADVSSLTGARLYHWAASGALPTGLSLTPYGWSQYAYGQNLQGVPALGGNTSVRLSVTDDSGATASANVRLTIKPNSLTGVVAVSASGDGTDVLKSDGTVWAWGYNVGDGSWTHANVPVQVPGLSGVKSIASHSDMYGDPIDYAVKTDGTVWYWTAGQRPAQVKGLSNVKSLTMGMNTGMGIGGQTVFALLNDGTAMAWGNNTYGLLGTDGKTPTTPSPVLIPSGIKSIDAGSSATTAVMVDGTVWSWGQAAPAKVNGLSGVQTVAGTLALLNDGTLWTWSSDNSGTPSRVAGIDNVASFVRHWDSVFALKKDGSVWAWGSNSYGQLGTGDKVDRANPVQLTGLNGISSLTTGNAMLALRSDGTVWAWGPSSIYSPDGNVSPYFSVPTRLAGIAGVKDISGGSPVIKTDGSAWAIW